MKAALLLLFLTGCASVGGPSVVVPKADKWAPDTSGIARVIGYTIASACPVMVPEEGPWYYALTAGHVMASSGPFGMSDTHDAMWSNRDSSAWGVLTAHSPISKARDLIWVKSDRPFPKAYPIAKDAPLPKESLWVTGYDWRNESDAFAERVWKVETLRIVATHIIFKPSVDGGTSGDCVLNDKEEVVGIMAFGKGVGIGGEVGGVVGVWGELFPKLEE